MVCNRLRMNDDKAEIMAVGIEAKLTPVPQTFSLTVCFYYTILSQSEKPRVYLESNLSMD